MQYRQAGRSRRAAIGEDGSLTADEVRSEAKKLLGIAEADSAPVAERRKACDVRTFGAMAEEFFALHVSAKRKDRTAHEYRRIFANPHHVRHWPEAYRGRASRTKILALTDAPGNLVRIELLPGYRFDTVGVPPLIEGLEFAALIADTAFDSDTVIADLDARGAKAVISQHPRRSRKRLTTRAHHSKL
ncbi:MAG: hypothetical protein J2P49_02605 [Methylocapsa sp.]|nr:hypothetical protein [Methylocapsa sp.]